MLLEYQDFEMQFMELKEKNLKMERDNATLEEKNRAHIENHQQLLSYTFQAALQQLDNKAAELKSEKKEREYEEVSSIKQKVESTQKSVENLSGSILKDEEDIKLLKSTFKDDLKLEMCELNELKAQEQARLGNQTKKRNQLMSELKRLKEDVLRGELEHEVKLKEKVRLEKQLKQAKLQNENISSKHEQLQNMIENTELFRGVLEEEVEDLGTELKELEQKKQELELQSTA